VARGAISSAIRTPCCWSATTAISSKTLRSTHILHLDKGKLTLYRGGYRRSFEETQPRRDAGASTPRRARSRKPSAKHACRPSSIASRPRPRRPSQAQSRVKRAGEDAADRGHVEDADVQPITFPEPGASRSRRRSSSGKSLRRLRAGASRCSPRLTCRIDNGRPHRPAGRRTATASRPSAKLIGGKSGAAHRAMCMRANQAQRSAYFAQHQLDELQPRRTRPFDACPSQLMPDMPEAQRPRALRHHRAFPPTRPTRTVLENLSGGEKARLLLGLAAFTAVRIF
jgi:ATP-binding cassette subfamily F protein 3